LISVYICTYIGICQYLHLLTIVDIHTT